MDVIYYRKSTAVVVACFQPRSNLFRRKRRSRLVVLLDFWLFYIFLGNAIGAGS